MAGNSEEETLAFLACVAQDNEFQELPMKLGLVFDSVHTVRELAASRSPLVPVVRSEEAVNEAARALSERPHIIVRAAGQVDLKPDIVLGLPSHRAFEKTLAAMGLQNQADRLARESGRSPTILRRTLAKSSALKAPVWAKEEKIARRLIPIALSGAWKATKDADCKVVSSIGNCTPHEIEQGVSCLLQLDDSPIWSVGEYRGVSSKTDALFAVRRWVIKEDLRMYFEQAESVLAVPDPALELPENQRWAAAAYGKDRPHSDRLRSALRETLVVLALHGNDLFQERPGGDVEQEVTSLVMRLLTPLTYERLLSLGDSLPEFAEAAPEAVLGLFYQDAREAEPVSQSLLRPVQDALFERCPRIGLLWALECLAWNPQWLLRVSLILAKLARTPINDNVAHTPITSLKAIYSSWMPQTAACVSERNRVLSKLADEFPDIVSEICLDQLNLGTRIGDESYRPLWRNDAAGAGQVVPDEERRNLRA